ncbi:hypothetical protein QTJ16_000294 [Diplocarpon rosae]|nr:hypothetical protein QTJ16_000294 [Diplocarpon rosae]
MAWGPVKKSYGINGERVYDELNTGNWWWEMQNGLPPGGTLVPVIIATDKTIMTKLGGDRVVWPVYLQIGNHARRLRRQQQSPSTILLGLLPISQAISKSTDNELAASIKSELYHHCMSLIFQEMEQLTINGWFVNCADGFIRHCFPVLGPMSIDHEEVCLAYGIKHNRQCARCEVEYSHLQDITAAWPIRTEQNMRKRIQEQQRKKLKKEDPQWVHPIEPFFWRHLRSDMHANLAVDMLHGLQKGVFRNLVDMTIQLVHDLYPAKNYYGSLKTFTKVNRKLRQSVGLVQLDARFNRIPRFQGLKHFNKFSQVTQWTGGEERNLIRIWIPIVTPLLSEKAPEALAYSRALVDFILIAQSITHNESTIGYLGSALYRIDALKEAFNKYRPNTRDDANWNTPKFHMLSHYADFIRQFGAPNGFDTEHLEAPHKFLLKEFYERTNKNDTYLDQIASHNTRANNLKAMAHRILDYSTTRSALNVEVTVRVTRATATPLLHNYYSSFGPTAAQSLQYQTLHHPEFTKRYTTSAGEAARGINLPGFLEALALFVYQERRRYQGYSIPFDYAQLCLKDSAWVADYPIVFLGAVKCWKRSGKDETDSEAMVEEILRCSQNWRGNGVRKDFCWLQAFPRSTLSGTSRQETINPWNGTRVAQLQVVLKILDLEVELKDAAGRPPTYYGALADVFPFRGEVENPKKWHASLGQPDKLHGMIEVTRAQVPTALRPTKLQGRRFFRMADIYRSAHVISSYIGDEERRSNIFYVNNYIDWDQYQTYYRDGWEDEGRRHADDMRRGLLKAKG